MGEPRDFFEFYDEDDAEEPYPGFDGTETGDTRAGEGAPEPAPESRPRPWRVVTARGVVMAAGVAIAAGIVVIVLQADSKDPESAPDQAMRSAAPMIETDRPAATEARNAGPEPRENAPGRTEGSPHRKEGERKPDERHPRPPDRAQNGSVGSAEPLAVTVAPPAPVAPVSPPPDPPPIASEPVREATAADVVQAIGP